MDITMHEIIGWGFPEQWLQGAEMEDDESNLTIEYQAINTDEVLVQAEKVFNGCEIDYHLTIDGQEWLDALKETIKNARDTEPEYGDGELSLSGALDAVREWISDMQGQIEHYAEEKFDSMNDGSYWDGEY